MLNRAYWYLMSAQTIAALGDTFGIIAIQWLVYQKTGSTLSMATLATASAVPEFVIRLFLSPLIDRVNRVRLMALLDLIRGLAYAFPVVIGAFGHLELWHLYVTAILTGSCSALFAPASMALVPSLVKGEQLVRGLSIMDASRTASLLLGPAMAGILTTWVGPLSCFGVNAICYGLSALLLLLLALTSGKIASPAPRPAGATYIKESLEGLAFFKHAPALLVVMVLVSLGNMSSVAMGSVMVAFAQQQLHFSAAEYGLLSSFSSGGILAGTLLVSIIGDIKKRRVFMLGNIVIRGLILVGLGLNSNKWIAIGLIICYGLCSPFFSSLSSGLYGRLVPEELRGRVMSIRLLIGGSLQPVGAMAGGSLATVYGLPMMFVAAGVIPAVVALSGFFMPALRGIDGDLTHLTEEIRLKTRPSVPTQSLNA